MSAQPAGDGSGRPRPGSRIGYRPIRVGTPRGQGNPFERQHGSRRYRAHQQRRYLCVRLRRTRNLHGNRRSRRICQACSAEPGCAVQQRVNRRRHDDSGGSAAIDHCHCRSAPPRDHLEQRRVDDRHKDGERHAAARSQSLQADVNRAGSRKHTRGNGAVRVLGCQQRRSRGRHQPEEPTAGGRQSHRNRSQGRLSAEPGRCAGIRG